MIEPQSATDLRIIAEMAEEIDARGMTALPGSLRRFVRTARGQHVAATLERVARELVMERHANSEELARLHREIDGLRSTVEKMTDAALTAETKGA